MRKGRIRKVICHLHGIKDKQFEFVTVRPVPKIGRAVPETKMYGSLAYHVIMLFPNEALAENQRLNCSRGVTSLAQRVLGITHEQAGDLFLAATSEKSATQISLDDCISALTTLLHTGQVKWHG